MTEDDLDPLFAAARAEPPRLPAGLMARVIAGAEAEIQAAGIQTTEIQAAEIQAKGPSALAATRAQASGLWRGLAGLFGGAGALAGMLTATIAGFWIGFADPAPLGAMSAALTGSSAEIDMMPGIDALLDEAP